MVRRRLEVERGDLRAVAGQDLGDALADAAAGARDDGHAAGQSLHLDHRCAPRVAGRAAAWLVTFPVSR